jgi:hypothetical protein
MIKIPSPEDIAREILSVQPMDEAGKAFYELWKNSKTEDELRAAGYEPVSQDTRIMWVKKDNQ